jgi:hypothetical protein
MMNCIGVTKKESNEMKKLEEKIKKRGEKSICHVEMEKVLFGLPGEIGNA